MNRLLPIRLGMCFLFLAACQSEKKATLPFYNDPFFTPHWFTQTEEIPKNFHRISSFSLINQEGKVICNSDFVDKIYVADFFFTTCQSICPIMTKNMLEIQEQLKNDKEILLLSHTVTPEIDSVQQLKKYALENNIDDNKWNLVTGDKRQIYDLARKSYLAVEDSEFGDFDMIHTENFMLIDKQRQIRGFYDGTDKKEIERLLLDIEILKNLN